MPSASVMVLKGQGDYSKSASCAKQTRVEESERESKIF